MGVRPFPGEDGARFEQAKELYRARAALFSDDANQQFAAGRFFFLAGDMDSAAAAFRASLKLDPVAFPRSILLARSLAAKGEFARRGRFCKTIPRDDPGYAAAQQLLAEDGSEDRRRKGAAAPRRGQAQFLDGQVKYQQEVLPGRAERFRAGAATRAAGGVGRKGANAAGGLPGKTGANRGSRSRDASPSRQTPRRVRIWTCNWRYVELLFETGAPRRRRSASTR